MMTPSTAIRTPLSTSGSFEDVAPPPIDYPSSPEGYASLAASDYFSSHDDYDGPSFAFEHHRSRRPPSAEGFEGVQGIYRFLQECAGARR